MSRTRFDLEAAARESEAKPWELSFRGEAFTMPGAMAAEALVVYGRWVIAQREAEAIPDPGEANAVRLEAFTHLDRLTSLLFASDADYARFQALRPSEAQRQALVIEAIRRWGGGLEPGESQASRPSSSGNGRPSRRTFSAATG